MRPMRNRSAQASAHDPAPSRITYRLHRMWLSPFFRLTVTRLLPLFAVVALAAAYFTHPDTQTKLKGWGGDLWSSVEARPEFQIRQMEVIGASPVLANAIRERVALRFPVSWFQLDPETIRTTVSALDAVADVRVTLELRGALRLEVREREPAAIWRKGNNLVMLDATGHRIAYIDRRNGRPDLPLVTGHGADAAIPEVLALHDAAEPLMPRLRGYRRQGERRWDVVLTDEQVIQLPETGSQAAFERVLAMHDAKEILDRDVPVVDMRDPDRPTVRLGAAAVDYLKLTRAFEKGLTSE